MGWLFAIARTVAKLGVILIGTVLLRNVSALLLLLVPMPIQVTEIALTLATFCYVGALAVLVFGRSVRGMKWPVLLGFGVVALVLAAGGLLAVGSLIRATPNLAVLLLVDLVFGLALLLFSDRGWLRTLDLADRSRNVAAIEVHRDEPGPRTDGRIRLSHILSALALADVPVGFRFQHLPDSDARLFFFTWAPDDVLLDQRRTHLHQLLAAHLPGVTLSSCKLPTMPLPAQLPSAPIYFRGSPGSAADGFAALEAALDQPATRSAAILFQVFAAPARLGRLDEWVSRRRVESQAKSARHLLAAAALLAEGVPPPPKEAEALSKPAAVARAQQVLQQLRRLDASDLLATQVALVVWHPTSHATAFAIGERLASRLASALQATTPGASVLYRSPWRSVGRRQVHRLLRAVPAGSTAFLLPTEAAAYLGIP